MSRVEPNENNRYQGLRETPPDESARSDRDNEKTRALPPVRRPAPERVDRLSDDTRQIPSLRGQLARVETQLFESRRLFIELNRPQNVAIRREVEATRNGLRRLHDSVTALTVEQSRLRYELKRLGDKTPERVGALPPKVGKMCPDELETAIAIIGKAWHPAETVATLCKGLNFVGDHFDKSALRHDLYGASLVDKAR